MNNALLRFYYGGNPEKWTDEKYYKRVCEMEFVLEYTGVLTKKK
jgi:hypothetical protein